MSDLFSAALMRPTPGAPSVDAQGRLHHRCGVAGCDRPAVFGEGVNLRRWHDTGDARALGRWWCGVHWAARAAVDGRAGECT